MRKIVLITGGRAYRDRERVYAVLDEEAPDLVIHGAASTYDPVARATYGADHFAGEWAAERRCPVLSCPADWTQGGRGGPIRNTGMLGILSDLTSGWASMLRDGKVVAFPGGRGTADCVAKARCAGFEIREVTG